MRNLTVEYLRVFFMFLIVLLHIMYSGYGLGHIELGDDFISYLQCALLNLVGYGVTGFIFISGYYGVSCKLERLCSLWSQTTFYALLSVILVGFVGGEKISAAGILNCFFALFDNWWFIADYVILMIISPIINTGINSVSKSQFRFIIVVLCFVLYFVQWIHNRDSSMSLLLFITVYLTGRYIRMYPEKWLDASKYWLFVIFFVLTVGLPILVHATHHDELMKFVRGNNNFLRLASVITLFLICNSIQIIGKGNFITRNILSVYLIHTCGYGMIVIHSYYSDPTDFNILRIIIEILSLIIGCCLFDEIRIRIMKPLDKFVFIKLSKLNLLNYNGK